MFDIHVPWGRQRKASGVAEPPTLQVECEMYRKWYEEARDELEAIRQALAPFETAGKANEDERDTPLQLALNAHAQLNADTGIIQGLRRDNEDLLQQLEEQRQEYDRTHVLNQELQGRLVQEIAWKDELAEKVRSQQEEWQRVVNNAEAQLKNPQARPVPRARKKKVEA